MHDVKPQETIDQLQALECCQQQAGRTVKSRNLPGEACKVSASACGCFVGIQC